MVFFFLWENNNENDNNNNRNLIMDIYLNDNKFASYLFY